jgi:branched-subunit amino acid ABC-type transport system permease component
VRDAMLRPKLLLLDEPSFGLAPLGVQEIYQLLSGVADGGIYARLALALMIAVTLAVLILVFLFFRFTRLGLAMRAAARNPVSSRLVGIRLGRMSAFGWWPAAAI